MSDVLQVLEGARKLVRDEWGSGNLDAADSFGNKCASIAIGASSPTNALQHEAHVALLRAIGVQVPADPISARSAVYRFNDSQPNRWPVVAAFDKAIATAMLQAHLDATPEADATLAVMGACDEAAKVLAGAIVAKHPEVPLDEITALASAELFYAAQDTAKAADAGVTLQRA